MPGKYVKQLPILNYHGVESNRDQYLWLDEEKPYVLSLRRFEEQMDLISDSGFASLSMGGLDQWFDQEEWISIPRHCGERSDEAIRALPAGRSEIASGTSCPRNDGVPVERRSIMLTFDDGHVSHHEEVLPVLKQRKLNAIFFIPAGLVGYREQMTWPHLRQLLLEGFEIGSHGLRHIPLTHLKEATAGGTCGVEEEA